MELHAAIALAAATAAAAAKMGGTRGYRRH